MLVGNPPGSVPAGTSDCLVPSHRSSLVFHWTWVSRRRLLGLSYIRAHERRPLGMSYTITASAYQTNVDNWLISLRCLPSPVPPRLKSTTRTSISISNLTPLLPSACTTTNAGLRCSQISAQAILVLRASILNTTSLEVHAWAWSQQLRCYRHVNCTNR